MARATWSVTYETATIQAGTAPTMEEADRIAANVHDSYVIKGLNPDALAWHVTPTKPKADDFDPNFDLGFGPLPTEGE